jgi:hypothetical protein
MARKQGCDGGRVSCLPLLSWGCLAVAPGSRLAPWLLHNPAERSSEDQRQIEF